MSGFLPVLELVFYFLVATWLLAFFAQKWSADLQARVGPTRPGKAGILFPVFDFFSRYSMYFRSHQQNKYAFLEDTPSGLCLASVLFLPTLGDAGLGNTEYSLVWLSLLAVAVDLIDFLFQYFEGSAISQIKALKKFKLKLKIYIVTLLSAGAFVYTAASLGADTIYQKSVVQSHPVLIVQAFVLWMALVLYAGAHPYQSIQTHRTYSISRLFLCWVLLNTWVAFVFGAGLALFAANGIAFGVVWVWLFFTKAIPPSSADRVERLALETLASVSLCGWVLLLLFHGVGG